MDKVKPVLFKRLMEYSYKIPSQSPRRAQTFYKRFEVINITKKIYKKAM